MYMKRGRLWSGLTSNTDNSNGCTHPDSRGEDNERVLTCEKYAAHKVAKLSRQLLAAGTPNFCMSQIIKVHL